MIGKNKIKFITSLREKKYRNIHKKFIIEGNKIVSEVLLKDPAPIVILICNAEWIKSFPDNLLKKIPEIIIADEADMKKLSSLRTGSQAIAVMDLEDNTFDINKILKELVISLDNIQDPGNLGTIIRTADWFGIRNIICSNDTVDCYNPKVLQSTMGSIFRVKVFYTEMNYFLKEADKQGLNIYGTFTGGEPVYSAELSQNGVIVMGNESKGISTELLPYIKRRLTIPFFADASEKVESLNVSVATAIICSEFRRRAINQ